MPGISLAAPTTQAFPEPDCTVATEPSGVLGGKEPLPPGYGTTVLRPPGVRAGDESRLQRQRLRRCRDRVALHDGARDEIVRVADAEAAVETGQRAVAHREAGGVGVHRQVGEVPGYSAARESRDHQIVERQRLVADDHIVLVALEGDCICAGCRPWPEIAEVPLSVP